MKAVLSLLALLAIAEAGAPSITICSTPRALLQSIKYTLHPNDIASDENLTIDVTADVLQDVDNGTIALDVWAEGIHIVSQSLDLCETAAKWPYPCPFKKGTLDIHYVAVIPTIPYVGKISVNAEITTKAGLQVVCAQGSVWITDRESQRSGHLKLH